MAKQKTPVKPKVAVSPFSNEIREIKEKNEKINLYLALLEQDLVSLPAVAAYSLSSSINYEIKEFVLSRLKELTGEAPKAQAGGFSETDVKALKFIANKFNNQPQPSAPPPQVAAPVVAEYEEDETEEYEDEDDFEDEEEEIEEVVVKPKMRRKVAKPKRKPKVSDSHLIKTPVTVHNSDGTTRQEISVTHKIVKPPATVNRIPPPTFEQEYLAARAATAGFQRQADQLQQLPMVGASEGSDD